MPPPLDIGRAEFDLSTFAKALADGIAQVHNAVHRFGRRRLREFPRSWVFARYSANNLIFTIAMVMPRHMRIPPPNVLSGSHSSATWLGMLINATSAAATQFRESLHLFKTSTMRFTWGSASNPRPGGSKCRNHFEIHARRAFWGGGLTTMINYECFSCGGDMASTWVVKLQEHAGAHEVLFKNVQTVLGNTEYALAA